MSNRELAKECYVTKKFNNDGRNNTWFLDCSRLPAAGSPWPLASALHLAAPWAPPPLRLLCQPPLRASPPAAPSGSTAGRTLGSTLGCRRRLQLPLSAIGYALRRLWRLSQLQVFASLGHRSPPLAALRRHQPRPNSSLGHWLQAAPSPASLSTIGCRPLLAQPLSQPLVAGRSRPPAQLLGCALGSLMARPPALAAFLAASSTPQLPSFLAAGRWLSLVASSGPRLVSFLAAGSAGCALPPAALHHLLCSPALSATGCASPSALRQLRSTGSTSAGCVPQIVLRRLH